MPVDVHVIESSSIDRGTWCEEPSCPWLRLVTTLNYLYVDIITCVIADEWHYNASISIRLFDMSHVCWIREINRRSGSSPSSVLVLWLQENNRAPFVI